MTVRTLGIEEELLLLDPTTRQVSSRSHEVIKRFREHGAGRDHVARATVATDELDQELFLHQIETRTDPTDDSRTRSPRWSRHAVRRVRRRAMPTLPWSRAAWCRWTASSRW